MIWTIGQYKPETLIVQKDNEESHNFNKKYAGQTLSYQRHNSLEPARRRVQNTAKGTEGLALIPGSVK